MKILYFNHLIASFVFARDIAILQPKMLAEKLGQDAFHTTSVHGESGTSFN